MTQFPNVADQWRVRISLRGQGRESREYFPVSVRVDPVARCQFSYCNHHFDVEEVRYKEVFVTPGKFVSDGIGEDAVGEEFGNGGGIQKNHCPPRSARIIRAAVS